MSRIRVTGRSVVPALRPRSRPNSLPAVPLARPPTDRLTDFETTRLIGRVLFEAARRLEVEFDWLHGDLRDLCCKLMRAADGNGKLDPIEYRIASRVGRFHSMSPTITDDLAQCSDLKSPTPSKTISRAVP